MESSLDGSARSRPRLHMKRKCNSGLRRYQEILTPKSAKKQPWSKPRLWSRREIASALAYQADMISHPAVFMIQYPDHYGAFVSISTDQRGVRSWGYAEEERWDEKWSRGGERGLVLEKTKAERVEAARLCLVRAYHVACSPLENSGRKPSAGGQSNGNDQIGSLPDSFRALVDLADRAAVKARK